jgi:hypothetical protein
MTNPAQVKAMKQYKGAYVDGWNDALAHIQQDLGEMGDDWTDFFQSHQMKKEADR